VSSTARRLLLPGAEPFEHPGGSDLGVLLLHGFTGSPFEMRSLGTALAVQGIGSACPLLSGHGTHPNDMVGVPYTDWLADVEAALDRMLANCQRVVLAGLSMGGTLALNVAARRAGDPRIAGLVTISAPLRLDDWRLNFANLIVKVVKWQAWGKPDIKDRTVWDQQTNYRRIRTDAILELLGLLADTRERLARVHQPILIVRARDDHIVPPRNAEVIYDTVRSADRRVLMLDNCYHVSTVDFDAPILCAEVVRFVQRFTAPVGSETRATDG
jgi:carboxylesterase